MANKTISTRIVLKNDSKTNWTTNDPVLLKGEFGIEFDPNATANNYKVNFKIGDGVHNWSELPYQIADPVTLPVPDGTTIVDDNGTWKLAGYDAASANTFPVKRITNGVASIEWVALPTHFADIDTMYTNLTNHLADTSNPHSVTATQAGAVATTANQGLTTTQQGNARDNIGLGSAAVLDVATTGDASITQVVKGDDSRLTDARSAADVYEWAKAETKPTYTANEVGAVPTTDVGAANGVAELDANGKVPASQLPSYVDDVIEGYYNTTDGKFYEESTYTTEIAGETGKIYVSLDTDKTYRWSGSAFVVISETLALGETSSTAYRGDRGKTAYDHSQTAHAPANAEANAIDSVSVGGTALTPGASKDVNIPVAGASALGVVKSSSAGDKVAVGNDGTMEVNSLSTDKLTQGTDVLIFDCGDSSN